MKNVLKWLLALVLSLGMLVEAFGAPAYDTVSTWAKSNMQQAYTLGWVSEDMIVRSKEPMTRKEFCAMAVAFYRTFSGKSGITMAESPFYDEKGQDVAFCVENGVLTGLTDSMFGGAGNVTREEMALFVKNLLTAAGVRFRDVSKTSLTFRDGNVISADCRDAVKLLSGDGVIQGYGDQFYPLTNVTVEQAVSMLLKAKDVYQMHPITIGNATLRIGDSVESVTKQLGAPVRKDINEFGFERYVYHKNYQDFILVGIRNGEVAEIYTNSKNLNYLGMTSETTSANATVALQYLSTDAVGATVPAYEAKVLLFFDTLGGDVLDGVYARAWDLEKSKPLDNKSLSRNLLEIVNAGRVKHGLTPFVWSDAAAYTAFVHSTEMAHTTAVSYTNKLGDSPFDRMRNYGISYILAAENLSTDCSNSVSIYYDWMQNAGSRSNLLDANLTRAGVGMYAKGNDLLVATMDMYQP